MNIQTRPSRDSDYQWLLELHHTVYRDLITQEFGYWDEVEELGLFRKAWESKPIEIHMLDEIQIDPSYQNQGIGTEVIGQLIVRARARHLLPLRLRVLHVNQGACRLYQKLGFRQIDRAKHHTVMERT